MRQLLVYSIVFVVTLLIQGGYVYSETLPNRVFNQNPVLHSKDKNQIERSIFNQTPEGKAVKSPELPQKIKKITYSNSSYQRNYCVRLCDGFFFPVVTLRQNDDIQVYQEEICASFCPGTPTAFYRTDGSSIHSAINAAGQSYRSLPEAYKFRKAKYDQACSCQNNGKLGVNALKASHDITLKKGDLVNLNDQMSVFEGGNSFPYRSNSFQLASNSKELPKLTFDFLENLKGSDQFKVQMIARTHNPLAPVLEVNSSKSTIIYNRPLFKEGDKIPVRDITYVKTAPKKALTFKEYLEGRQKSIVEFGL